MTSKPIEHFERYGWKCNETNLDTLPPTAPEAAKDLAKWLTLEGRRSSLQEYLNVLADDGRIHGKFWPIGAWTHRMSHSSPNQANVAAVFDGPVISPVDEVKSKYNARIRECFIADRGTILVGTDADGIQLRILAHYMESEVYRDALVRGDKKLGTDEHSVNKDSLGPICKSRDDAKTFIYAWLLGARLPRIANILDCTIAEARIAEQNFLKSLPDLNRIKKVMVPKDARRGYFIGLDGRKVRHRNEHGMLAGYLQAGEAVVMKKATMVWYKKAKEEGIKFKFLNFVHDEWQTAVYDGRKQAERLGQLQCEALETVGEDLGLFCPLSGTSKFGFNWHDTH